MTTDDLNDSEFHEFHELRTAAQALPSLTPSRDLWPGIAARIGAAPAVPARRFGTWTGARLAMAASLLVVASSAITWTLASRTTDTASAATMGFAGGVDDETAAALHLTALDASVTSMDEEIALLQAIVNERRSTLDARTVGILTANLKVIDAAIAESRKALAADPASQFLAAQFARAYTSKLTLLRDAATLPTDL